MHPQMNLQELYARMDGFIAGTRQAVHVRKQDKLLMIRPEKTMGINETAMHILSSLYAPIVADGTVKNAETVIRELASYYHVEQERIAEDAKALLDTIGAMMRDDFTARDNVRRVPFEPSRVKYPVLAEIALTYQCNNRCSFCYAASPMRGPETHVMTTEQCKVVIEKIACEAYVPTLSFTGGEATLRKDLPELIRHASSLGLRVNLITNGVLAANEDYAKRLVDHGLASAQVSIEAGDAELHDKIVGRKGAFKATTGGIRAFKKLGIHVHTNSTLCAANFDKATDIMRYISQDLGLTTQSMNMLIRTGLGLDPQMQPVTYTQVAKRLPELVLEAKRYKLKFVWYSPLPYCIANPVLLGQGAKSCACVSGILSVNPAGEVLPCSSFQEGIGSLLHNSFEQVYTSEAARYWRERRYVPPPCKGCADVDICAGACPLYWDAVQSFREIPVEGSSDGELFREWNELRQQGKSFGVPCPKAEKRVSTTGHLPTYQDNAHLRNSSAITAQAP